MKHHHNHKTRLTGAALLAFGLITTPAVVLTAAGQTSEQSSRSGSSSSTGDSGPAAPTPRSETATGQDRPVSPTDPTGRPIDRGSGNNPNRINQNSSAVGVDNSRPRTDSMGGVAAGYGPQHAHQKADEVIGRSVRGSGGEDLGQISDLVVETQSGQIHYAIVSSGGVLGIGGTRRAVPFKALQPSGDSDDRMSIAVDQARWDNVPRFRNEDLATLNQETRAQELHEYFGQDWDETQHLNRAQNASPSEARGSGAALLLVSDLDDKEIRAGDKELGEVEDVLINLDRRVASLLVDVDDDFAETDDDFVVGFNQITVTGSGRELALSTRLSAADFAAGARVDDLLNSGRPYAWSDDAEGQTTRTTAPTAAAQAHPNSGLEATRAGANYAKDDSSRSAGERLTEQHADAVRRALSNDSGLRTAARNVDVNVEDNRLVLSGAVSSESERERVLEAARRAADGQSIDDQIRVREAAE